jgi:hypothetical protein
VILSRTRDAKNAVLPENLSWMVKTSAHTNKAKMRALLDLHEGVVAYVEGRWNVTLWVAHRVSSTLLKIAPSQ